jgi:hypothetical protein
MAKAGEPRRKKFDAERREELLDLLRQGYRRGQACKQVGIHPSTFNGHINKNPKFKTDVMYAEMEANEKVETALYMAAVGNVKKKIQPNVTACQVWLYNRCPEVWADKRNIGRARPKDGKTPDVSLKSPEDIRKVCETLIATMFQEGTAVDAPNQVAGLMKTWMEAFGLEKIETLEKKIAEIEKEREKK